MSQRIHVIGHTNPDTDSICSAIAYANLKAIISGEDVIPARAGNVSNETQFVLDYFNVQQPILLEDIRSRVGDMLNGETISILPSTPLREVGILTRKKNAKTLAIVDEHNTLLGIITLGDIAERHMHELSLESLNKMHITLENVIRTLSGRYLVEQENEEELHGNIVIGTMNPETMIGYIAPGDVVLLGDRENAQLAAIKAKASLLIITGGFNVSEEVKKEAKNFGTIIISVPYDTFAAARLINLCAPVSSIMKHEEEIITFNVDDLVEDAKKVMLNSRFRNYPVVDDNNRYLGMISRYHLLALMKKKVILVDHNEKGQGIKGIEKAEVLEVIDHHRVGGIQTGEPIYFRNEPVGCTATIVATMYNEHQVPINKEIAGILLGAILSDTVIFKSPTCTERDKKMAYQLAEIAEVVAEEFGRDMYKVACSLVGRELKDIIFEDFKEFTFGELTMGIGQVSTMDVEEVKVIKDKLLKEMSTLGKEKGYHMTLLMVTDILREGTELLVSGDEVASVAMAFGKTIESGSTYLEGVMSRKKQVVPPLSKYFTTRL